MIKQPVNLLKLHSPTGIFSCFFRAILRNTYTFTGFYSLKLRKIQYQFHFFTCKYVWLNKNLLLNSLNQSLYLIKKQTFSLKILLLISILICSEYFNMTKIIRARNVKTVRNTEPKPWPHISGPGHGSESWVSAPGFWVLGLAWVLWVSGYNKVWQKIITKGDRYYKVWQLLQSVAESYYKVWQVLQSASGITKCNRYYKVWQKIITKSDRYYKVWQGDRYYRVWQLLSSET